MSACKGPQPGQRFQVLHSCQTHGTCLAVFQAELVTRLADRRTFRVHATRCDGTALEFHVDATGKDRHGYVRPVG